MLQQPLLQFAALLCRRQLLIHLPPSKMKAEGERVISLKPMATTCKAYQKDLANLATQADSILRWAEGFPHHICMPWWAEGFPQKERKKVVYPFYELLVVAELLETMLARSGQEIKCRPWGPPYIWHKNTKLLQIASDETQFCCGCCCCVVIAVVLIDVDVVVVKINLLALCKTCFFLLPSPPSSTHHIRLEILCSSPVHTELIATSCLLWSVVIDIVSAAAGMRLTCYGIQASDDQEWDGWWVDVPAKSLL